MFDKWLKLPAHYYLHITALSLLIVGVALSNVLMSIGTIWIIANWLIELDFNTKWQRFKKNKIVIAFSLLFLSMGLSLIWSADIDYGLKDLLIKLPLITIPLVMGTRKKLEYKIYIFLLYLFIASLTFTTVFNYIRYDINQLVDKRELSFFISHIRLGGLICLALFLTGYEIIKRKISPFLTPILAWFLYYLYFSQTISAYILFLILFGLTILYSVKSRTFKLIVLSVITILALTVRSVINNFIEQNKITNTLKEVPLDRKTASDHFYYHDLKATKRENGYLVWVNISERECRQEWNKRSKIDFDSTDYNGNRIMGTLFGYLTSKNLKKDSVGISKLTNIEITNIEGGQSNYLNTGDFKGKLTKVTKEYLSFIKKENPNGHSLIQRIEHLKTGINILKSDWLMGVGIGDVNQAFQDQYSKEKSVLKPEFRLRAHNQIITIWITLGLIGIILTLYILIKPLFTKKLEFTSLIISVALIFSFLTQDMIETQAGVTIFALFYSLSNFLNSNKTA